MAPKCWQNVVHSPRRPGSARVKAGRMAHSLQKNAIQRWRRLFQPHPAGSFPSDRRRDVVQAQETAREQVLSVRILAVTHQVNSSASLGKTRPQEIDVGLRRPEPQVKTLRPRPGVDRRVHVAEIDLVGRELARWPPCTIPQHEAQLLRAKSGSIRANGSVWNARSQAANQGNSHLSGNGDDVVRLTWPQRAFRRSCVQEAVGRADRHRAIRARGSRRAASTR